MAFVERLAAHARLPYVELDPVGGADPVDPAAAAQLASWSARALGVVPIAFDGERLVVAVGDPADELAAESVASVSGREVTRVLASRDAIARAQERVYGPPAPARAEPPAPPAPVRPLVSASERRRYRELAEHAGLDFVSLEPVDGLDPVNPLAAQSLSPELCRRFRLLPISARAGAVTIATAEPFDEFALRVVAAITGRRPRVVVAPPREIERAIDRVLGELPGTVEEPPPPSAAAPPRVAPSKGLLLGPAPAPRPLGELLLATGLIDERQLDRALEIQDRTGARLGAVLLHEDVIGERELAAALAEQLRLPELDVSGFEPDRAALELVPEPLARRHRFVPLAVRDHVLYLAMSDPLDDEAVRRLREHTSLPLRVVVASRVSVERLLQRLYSERYVTVAATDLLNRSPDESAVRVLTLPQKLGLAVLLTLTVLFFLLDPILAAIVFNAGSVIFYSLFSAYKLRLIYDALTHDLELPVTDEEVRALDERTLPTYTILVPLYREAAVVHHLVASIRNLDYPRAKLDVKLIVEEDDAETIARLEELALPAHFRTVVVPDRQPKTKPKACNYGLIQALGRFVVIYDAEDRPESDQLKKVVIAYSKAEERIACIQCKLNYFNRNQNILTRWFTSEYSNWFDLLMPGLDAADAPIPLGGTSNHFRTEKLIELGAWDPFNVTEDADLGIRLHKAGYKTAIIDSTTFEEANSDLYNWIRQRSRWVKGYIQTWLVHMRHPVKLWRDIGWRSFLSFQFMIAGTFFSFLVNPVYWLLTTAWLMTEAGVIRAIFPGFLYYAAAAGLYLGNFAFTYINVAGSMRRGYYDLVKWALLSPLYWALMSVGAWKGFLQLLYRPFYWEKTVHGLDVSTAEPARGRFR